ncbi:MAG: hypothetical protein WBV39_00740, partial [Rudaea sp.]
MKTSLGLFALIASLPMTSTWADSAPKALNLNLPPASMTAESPTAAPAKSKTTNVAKTITAQSASSIRQASSSATQPNVHYDAAANAIVDAADSRHSACDDANFGKPQVHGSIGMGVVAGN